MYVLEGLKDYMILNQWQVGDTVTFHRTEQEGKLIIGTKKMPASIASIQALKQHVISFLLTGKNLETTRLKGDQVFMLIQSRT
ncbi:hypothetical protein Pyn_40733 [Prunus yedoensis var. nudiflora]|uniref:Uncharacterized protein n=1 Tax=Prunus yedoensis var. nudiflora TaxID=2094558 RepID=A0A314XSW7_PRUYE|nr:hypothetical protein Pyn_40733 [Prunus yedoensis var. nudiflora]